ncbi:MAG: DEAD/DEAH box helicase [Puniceicoccaceae bacterium]|nr:MAG: DEAD/DEAH box helicase [Puniceicoccaceae bacterium]
MSPSGTENQNPEQVARDAIDAQLRASGWAVQSKDAYDPRAGEGQAVREYTTDVGPADYVLFVDRKAVAVVEAKKETLGHKITIAEDQTAGYAKAKLKWVKNKEPLPYLYEATGVITRFTDARDPKPRSREVFTFHRPETLREWLAAGSSLRTRLQDDVPPLDPAGLRACQIRAITDLDVSCAAARPRALIQMATGSGKTFTAITFIYRLLKFARAKRILFLVDTRNLGEQAEQEFMAYTPSDDSRKFTELYSVQRLRSSAVPKDAQVCISTIQRMYSILQEKPLDESDEETNPAEARPRRKDPFPVAYNPKVPIEHFDFIVVDECHRSIYNLWRQVLEYYDAFLIGLTATPDARTYAFFKQNVVSEYTHENAVADGVNVGNEVFVIETEVTTGGGTVLKGLVEKREKLSRRKRWEQEDEDQDYTAKKLDRDIVNHSQIRTVLRTFRDHLPVIFPEREEVPKTLIFAKTDSHADDIIQTVREVFDEGNEFCKKLTYKIDDDPKSVLADFRNAYHPRIAVTVDMIATGTDVKPLECLLFMRDVKSKNYFEQMKGRGTRTLDMDELRKVTPSAKTAKTHYVIVDAIGVTKSLKTASPQLITRKTTPFKDLAMEVVYGASDTDTVSSLAGRLARIERQLSAEQKDAVTEKTGGHSLQALIKGLFDAIDADAVQAKACEIAQVPPAADPGDDAREKAQAELVAEAAKPLTGAVVTHIVETCTANMQIMDNDTLDKVTAAEWASDSEDKARELSQQFTDFLAEHKDSLDALTIYFEQPQRRREVTFRMIKDVLAKLKADAPAIAPLRVWQAYAALSGKKIAAPQSELTALVALIRHVCGIDKELRPFGETVRRNFQDWIMQRHAGKQAKFTEEQTKWLQQIRDSIIANHHFQRDDLEYDPFDRQGGLGKMYQLFGDDMDALIAELNSELTA